MKKILDFLFFLLIILFIFIIIYNKFTDKFTINYLFGYSWLRVLTGSMEPEIKPGETIVIKKCSQYKKGDIVTFITKDKEVITHRISDIDSGMYYTKGDANNVRDPVPIEESQICGKVIFHFNSFLPINLFTFGKYIDSNSTFVALKVAKPIFVVDNDDEIIIDGSSDINTYNFSVKNFKEEEVSEVSMRYHITLIADDDIEYEVFLNDTLIDINNNFDMIHSVPLVHNFTLKIDAPEGYKGKIKMKIDAVQIKEEKNGNI